MIADRLLQRLGEALRDRESRRRLLRNTLRWGRHTLAGLTIAYFLSIFAAVFLMRWVGEKNLTLAFLLYLPRQGFLLPLPLLFLLTLPIHWRLALSQIPLALLFIKFGMSWQLGPESGPVLQSPDLRPASTLTVLTWNRGQHLNQSLQPFKELTQPDLIALQDAPHRAKRYAAAPDYSDLPHAVSDGEFTVISRYPITAAAAVDAKSADGSTEFPASRFEVDFEGRPIALYCVHAVSPRDTLLYYRGGAFLYGIPGIPGTQWNEKRALNQQFWDRRIESAEKLLEALENESLPYLIVGDFNSPSGGYIHGIFSRTLQDAHTAAGRGLGYTFPGRTRNPLSGGGPWMRIDFIFAGPDWDVLHSVTEEKRTSQHRATTATLRLH